jgi:hypothetical protein
MKIDAKRVELVHYRASSLNEVASQFYATNAWNPLYLTQNSYFGVFRTVLLQHKNRCEMGRTGAVPSKFAKRSCVAIFCNECTQSTPFDPKIMLWGVSDRFVSARKPMQNGPNWCTTGQVR